jgi:carbonic anhydrase/acetyltransferase-like protein (isoleucine patch superfamily)
MAVNPIYYITRRVIYNCFYINGALGKSLGCKTGSTRFRGEKMTDEEHFPSIDDSCFVHPSSTIIGKVRIKKDCSVWPYSVIRGDEELITINDRSNLQDGVIIHTDEGFPVTIGRDVTVGHGAVIHGCEIGDRCIIGIRSTILNGARIGEGSIIGAGAVVTPGTIIPPNSMVLGIPAKVKKEDPEFSKMALKNSEIYVELANKHKKGSFKTYGD